MADIPAWLPIAGALLLLALAAWPLFLVTGDSLRLRWRRALRRRLRASTWTTLRRFRARIDRFKLTRKAAVREALLRDPALARAVAASAARDEDPDVGLDLDGAWSRAEDYLEEIVPAFSVLSYFRFGYAVSHVALGGLYHLDVDKADLDRLRPWLKDQDKNLLFLINHKSNADFVLLAWALAHRVALSYAVGEWARVWPLEPLFKSFGSYFLRRGERDPLYHAVLSRYVQYIALNGVTQGVFLEGGLSRDGALRGPKTGLLDSLLLGKADPSFTRELWVVPAAVSYDRVLEDESLVMESFGRKPDRWQRRAMLWKQARDVARYVFLEGWRWPLARQRKFGRAAVRLGEPILVDAWLRANPGWLRMDRGARKEDLGRLADDVMLRIGRASAVLPVGLLAFVLWKRQALPADEARALFDGLAATLRQHGARLWQPHAREKDPCESALRMLVRRGLVRRVEGALVVAEKGREIVAYYGRGLLPWEREAEAVLAAPGGDRNKAITAAGGSGSVAP